MLGSVIPAKRTASVSRRDGVDSEGFLECRLDGTPAGAVGVDEGPVHVKEDQRSIHVGAAQISGKP